MNSFEEKRERRAERLEQRAANARQESDGLHEQARAMQSVIPFGQPILVGHHSEARDRNYRGRIENKHRKAYELHQEAEELERRAEACRNNQAIFSDDPDASEKLADKITRLEQRQQLMKDANKLARKEDRNGLAALGFSDELIDKLLTPGYSQGYGQRVGFASWALTNNGANIRRLKKRLEKIQAHADDETTTETIGDVKIIDNVENNRIQIFFPNKPAPEIRKELKSNGFRWAPSVRAWQRHRSDEAIYHARQICSK